MDAFAASIADQSSQRGLQPIYRGAKNPLQ